MSPAEPLPIQPPHDRLIAAAREWMLRSWGRHLASVESIFDDDTMVSLVPRSKLRTVPDGNPLVGRPIDRELFEAARAWGEKVREEYPATLRVIATDGSFATLTVPPMLPGPAEFVPDPPHFEGADEPPGPAWSFTDTTASYRGRAFEVRGLRHKLLRALAGHAGQDVPNGDLKQAVWGGRHAADDSQLRNLVCQLRTLLASTLNPAGETILATGGGAHRLTLS